MSKVRVAGANKNLQTEESPVSKRIMKDVVAVYVFFMFAVYPLYYEDKYYNMGDAKWHFFKWVTLVGIIVMSAVFIWYQAHLASVGKTREYWDVHRASVTDWFVLAYAVIALSSYLLSPYKADTLIGYDGWYMGLISQLAFVVIYYFVSRFWRWDDIVLVIYLAVSAAVFLICILNRFKVDPLEMYADLSEYYYIYFVSTLGQATWFSSYMVLLFPIGLFAFWNCEGAVKRIASGLYVLLGAVTMIAQNSDSALLAYFAIYLILFSASFDDNKKMQRFLESLVILFAGWKIMGILQVMYADRVVELSGLMRALSIGAISWILLAVSAGVLIGFIQINKGGGFDISAMKPLRKGVLYAVAGGVVLMVAYIALNTAGAFDGTPLASDNWYLLFDYKWGSDRGLSWIASVGTFVKTGFVRKLFGAGPDGFYNEVYRFYAEPLNAKWGENTVLTCAHNEWLNALINVGLLGAVAYIGIFISGMARFIKKSVSVPETLAPAMCIAAYMAHNFFCYQQIICTPIIFIIIGAGEMMSKHGRVEIWEPDGE
ncbi:MAG: O-antigen ligase family protein [Lachnospiraceae bacterium]|nr:O-antigen ligase family protein [Lachnospiraceae bacterium]